MEALLYFVLWAGMIFIMMRFGCGAHVMGHGSHKRGGSNSKGQEPGEALRWVAPLKAVDPVCGKRVVTDSAKPSVFAGGVYYFCSRDCREIFEAAPDVYAADEGWIGKERGGGNGKERSHG